MVNVTDKFGDWIKEGFEVYKNNLGVLIVSFLIAFILSSVTLGVLFGPMTAGLILITLRILDKDEPAPVIGDIFNGFSYFVPTLLFSLVWGLIILVLALILLLIPCLGPILYICAALFASTSLMFGYFLIVDKKMSFWDASMASFEKVKSSFFPFLGLSLVAGILGQLGSVACGLGVIVTMPLYFTILGITYRDVFASDEQAPELPPQPEMPPKQESKPEQPPEMPTEPEGKPEQPENSKE